MVGEKKHKKRMSTSRNEEERKPLIASLSSPRSRVSGGFFRLSFSFPLFFSSFSVVLSLRTLTLL